ncbi:MAG: nickel pincer cofactor biosynthesis protein LarB [Parahaliea sp.]
MNGQPSDPVSEQVMLDLARGERTGQAEAVYCAGKSALQIDEILRQVAAKGGRILLTRLGRERYAELEESHRRRLDYDVLSGTAFLGGARPSEHRGRVAVVAAGTSDVAVAREVVRTLAFSGEQALVVNDVGVAGLWRLMQRLPDIRSARIVIAVAGMDAALPTVLGGLVATPVIGVPTSVGYGVAAGGETALRAMLASCASGLLVSNIDNGYGAACAALRMLNTVTR